MKNKSKNYELMVFIFMLVISIIAVSVIWAAYSSNLYIKGSGDLKKAKWSIKFSDLSSAKTGNVNGHEVTAIEKVAPHITGGNTIETFKVELQTPGDWIGYNFKIVNDGDFNARIDTGFALPKPTCSAKEGGTLTTSEINTICNNLTYTLTYVSDGSDVKVGDVFTKNSEKELFLKLAYKGDVDASNLPSEDITIQSLNIVIPFIQD